MKRIHFVQFVLRREVIFALVWAVWLARGEARSGAAEAEETAIPALEPFFSLIATNGKQRFVTTAQIRNQKLSGASPEPAFHAVISQEWLPGLAPVFEVEKANRIELRRRPARGVENSSEPSFFALAPEDDPDAGALNGRWLSRATHNNSRPYIGWDLALEHGQLAGRFNQNSEYRFAYVTGGSFRANAFEMNVDYIMDKYIITGKWHNGEMSGTWKRGDDSEDGTWTATREPAVLPRGGRLVELYEWRRSLDDARRYVIEGDSPEDGWLRVERPLCRVWVVDPQSEPHGKDPEPGN